MTKRATKDRPAVGSVPNTGATRPDEAETPRRSKLFAPSAVNIKLIYAGYLMSLAAPFIAIIPAIFAYQSRRQEPPRWMDTHYRYQIRTFWIGLFANLAAFGLSFVGVGLLLFPLIAVWVVARSVKGLIRVARLAPVEDPDSYFV